MISVSPCLKISYSAIGISLLDSRASVGVDLLK